MSHGRWWWWTLWAGLQITVAPLGAQLVFVQPDSDGSERPLSGLYDVGTAQVGDLLEARIRLRNTGTVAVRLDVLKISGVGFSLENTPPPLFLMAAGTNADFRIRFRPTASGTFSATLQANSTSILVRGAALAGFTLMLDGAAVNNERPVEIGPVEAGKRATRTFAVRNDSGDPMRLTRVAVTGTALSVVTSPPVELPATVAAGASVAVEVRFEPVRAGIVSGTLIVEQRTVPLTGIAQEPAFSEVTIEFDPRIAQSGRQAPLLVTLAAPAPAAATATLIADFQPIVNSGAGDSAIQFPATGTRTVSVEFTRGQTAGTVNGKAEIIYQTGTTAGNTMFRLRLQGRERTFPVTIPPQAPRLDTVELRRLANAVEVVTTGFDNARTAGQFSFTFVDRAGRPLPVVTGDASTAFAEYFSQSTLGGLFRATARFPAAGDTSQIAAVDVTLSNTAGAGAARSGQ